jgi:hypothetical protein
LGCRFSSGFDIFFPTARAQAADNGGLRFGADLIWGFAVDGL